MRDVNGGPNVETVSSFEEGSLVASFRLKRNANLHDSFAEAYQHLDRTPNVHAVQFDFYNYRIKIERIK